MRLTFICLLLQLEVTRLEQSIARICVVSGSYLYLFSFLTIYIYTLEVGVKKRLVKFVNYLLAANNPNNC
jgi:hypothetical protein